MSEPKDREGLTASSAGIGLARRAFGHIWGALVGSRGSRGKRQVALSVAVLALATILVVGTALARLPKGPPPVSDGTETPSVMVARSGTLRWALTEASDMGRLACVAKGLPRFEVALLWSGRVDRASSPGGDTASRDAALTLGRTLALADTLQERLEQCGSPQPAEPRVEAETGSSDTDVVTPDVAVTLPLTVSNVVHFAFDRVDVEGHSVAVLDSVAAAILQVPGVLVELVGHTDVRGPSSYNTVLGERRADAVRRYLVGRGVAAERIQARSRGEEDNYRPNARSNRDHALNRRVEIRFVTPGSAPIRVHRQDGDLKFKPSRQDSPSELSPGASPPRGARSAGQTVVGGGRYLALAPEGPPIRPSAAGSLAHTHAATSYTERQPLRQLPSRPVASARITLSYSPRPPRVGWRATTARRASCPTADGGSRRA